MILITYDLAEPHGVVTGRKIVWKAFFIDLVVGGKTGERAAWEKSSGLQGRPARRGSQPSNDLAM